MQKVVSFCCVLTMTCFIASCRFNNLFLVPTKMEKSGDFSPRIDFKDSSYVEFNPIDFTPSLYDTAGVLVPLDYHLESFLFESESGNTLNGWYLAPRDVKPDVTLLHFHGNAGFLLYQFKAMDPLIKEGFQIFMFDYSGFGFSEGKNTRDNVLLDAHSALDYVLTREEIKNTQLVIYGQSLGGHLAAVVGEEREEDIDGLVIEGAFSSHSDIAAKMVPVLGRLFVRELYSAKKSIQAFNKPVLVIHSTEDEVIPFKQGLKIYEKANSPKTFYQIEHCHICGPRYYGSEIALKIRNMLNLSGN